jgi:hypothetical protein
MEHLWAMFHLTDQAQDMGVRRGSRRFNKNPLIFPSGMICR